MSDIIINWGSKSMDELRTSLLEIIREDRSRKPVYEFVDMGLVQGLLARRHHVIFGRRGSGKSVLLRELENRCQDEGIKTILVDIEAIAQKSYPNLIIEILLAIYQDLLTRSQEGLFSIVRRRPLINEIKNIIYQLEKLSQKADHANMTITESETANFSREFQEQLNMMRSILNITMKVSDVQASEMMTETGEKWEKTRELFSGLDQYKNVIQKWLKQMGKETIYILIDDFYQIDLCYQPLVADYLKRLVRGLPCYLKIATVKNRSLLFVKSGSAEAGMQTEHDYTGIALDFSLDDFDRAKRFLSTILENVFSEKVDTIKTEGLFESSNYFNYMDILTEASGGNPRDLINLLQSIIEEKRSLGATSRISQGDIRKSAVAYQKRILEEVERSFEYFDSLNELLRIVIETCQKKSDIGLYITKEDERSFPVIYSLLGQLIDSRLLHLLTHNYTVGDKRSGRASVCLLAMGVYGEFSQTVSLVSRSKEEIYPRLNLKDLSTNELFSSLPPELRLIGG